MICFLGKENRVPETGALLSFLMGSWECLASQVHVPALVFLFHNIWSSCTIPRGMTLSVGLQNTFWEKDAEYVLFYLFSQEILTLKKIKNRGTILSAKEKKKLIKCQALEKNLSLPTLGKKDAVVSFTRIGMLTMVTTSFITQNFGHCMKIKPHRKCSYLMGKIAVYIVFQ